VVDVDVRVGGHDQFVEVRRNTFDGDQSVFSIFKYFFWECPILLPLFPNLSCV
jgi:hypothetical protein